jgi:hypothetical protein
MERYKVGDRVQFVASGKGVRCGDLGEVKDVLTKRPFKDATYGVQFEHGGYWVVKEGQLALVNVLPFMPPA